MRLPAGRVGATAVDLLLERMSGPDAAGGAEAAERGPQRALLPAEVVVRASTMGER